MAKLESLHPPVNDVNVDNSKALVVVLKQKVIPVADDDDVEDPEMPTLVASGWESDSDDDEGAGLNMEDVQRLNSTTKPKNTLKLTQTALNNFEQYRVRRNKILLATGSPLLKDRLQDMSIARCNEILPLYIRGAQTITFAS
jgi:hypothetical protein